MRLSSYLLAAPAMAALAAAQTTSSANGLDIFLSEAYSVYTEVTSILASDAQNTASSRTSSSASSTSTSTSSSSSSSSSTSSSATTGSTASLAGAAATSAAASATQSSHHSNTLAIVLGSVLGAVVLGLIILFLLICCHRRRRTKAASIENRAHSPEDEEVESWRGNNPHRPNSSGGPSLGPHATHGHDHPMAAAAAIGPQMAEHPAYRNSHENPFVPTPPPPRRSAPNSRVGLTDGTVPGQPPFVTGGKNSPGRNGGILSRGNGNGHHAGEALAAGAGGAALGAAAVHHNNRREEPSAQFPEKRYSGHGGSLNRKPVPTRAADGADAPLMSEKDVEGLDSADVGSGSGRRHSPQYGPDGPYTSLKLSPFNAAGHARNPSQEHLMSGAGGTAAAAAVAGAGFIGGAALARHQQQGHGSYDSGFYSNDGRQQSRERARQSSLSMSPLHTTQSPNNMPPDYDTSNRGYTNAPTVPPGMHKRSGSNSPRTRRESTPPTVPSRSPKRTRFSDLPYDVPGGRPAGSYAESSSRSGTNSDESTYRLAPTHQVPGGWRDSAESDLHLRNSGINQHGRRSNSPRQSWEAAGPSNRASQGVSQPRLSDLKAEEEQAMLSGQRGRINRGTIPSGEWLGHGGGGYQGEDHGVGQAL